MKVIAVDALLGIAKDVTLANGAKHRCIDATQIHELPKMEIVRCRDCRFRYTECCIVKDQPLMDTFYCWQGTPKDGDGNE